MFAIGDVRAGSVKRVASAVGEGSVVIQHVHRHLETSRRAGRAPRRARALAVRDVGAVGRVLERRLQLALGVRVLDRRQCVGKRRRHRCEATSEIDEIAVGDARQAGDSLGRLLDGRRLVLDRRRERRRRSLRRRRPSRWAARRGPSDRRRGSASSLHVVRRGLEALLREGRRVRELRRRRSGGRPSRSSSRCRSRSPRLRSNRLAVGPIVGAAASRCDYGERDGSSSEGENATHDRTLAGSGGDQHEERDDRPRRELACRA